MRFHHVLDEVLGQRSKVALLRFLVRTRGEYSGRDLARLLDLDHKTCHTALRSLASQGIVHLRHLGTAVVYMLHGDHPVVQEILEPAFREEAGLVERYVREAKELSGARAESIILFGSVARREEGPQSDVDLYFVTRDPASTTRAREALDTAAVRLAARYGSVPQFMVEDRRTFRRKVIAGDLFHNEVLKTGRVIYGKAFQELLRDGGEKNRDARRAAR